MLSKQLPQPEFYLCDALDLFSLRLNMLKLFKEYFSEIFEILYWDAKQSLNKNFLNQ